MGSHDVDQAVAEMMCVLSPHEARDWQVRAGSLDWSCRHTAAHVAHDLLAYAGQVAVCPTMAHLPCDLAIATDASPHTVLQVITACGRLLSSTVTTASPHARAWHWGACDPTGFAAMGVAETLLHTYDITQGLGVPWLPPAPLCAVVLGRLLPDAPRGDPVQILLWSTGRAELAGHPRIASWVWKATVS